MQFNFRFLIILLFATACNQASSSNEETSGNSSNYYNYEETSGNSNNYYNEIEKSCSKLLPEDIHLLYNENTDQYIVKDMTGFYYKYIVQKKDGTFTLLEGDFGGRENATRFTDSCTAKFTYFKIIADNDFK